MSLCFYRKACSQDKDRSEHCDNKKKKKVMYRINQICFFSYEFNTMLAVCAGVGRRDF